MAIKISKINDNVQILQQLEFHMTMAQTEVEASEKLTKQLATLDLSRKENAIVNAEIESLKKMLEIISRYSIRALTSSMNIQTHLNSAA